MSGKHKLGHLLVQAGLITNEKLRQALAAQLICGGKLGTNLVELEMVPLDQVSRLLSSQLQVPEASDHLLGQVSDAVLALVPHELCARVMAIPFAAQNRTLDLAMLNPLDLEAVDELAFAAGMQVRTHVIPELRLYYFLERYLGVERPKRFLRVPRATATPPHVGVVPPPPQQQRRRYLEPTADIPEAQPLVLPTDHGGAGDPDLVMLDNFTQDPASDEELCEVTVEQPAPAQPPPPASSDELAQYVVRRLLPGTTVNVLLVVRGEMALGRAAHGVECPDSRVRQLVLSLAPASLLREALTRRAAVRGSSNDPMLGLMATFLGAPPPKDGCVAPIRLGDDVVQILCALAPEPLSPDISQTLCAASNQATTSYGHLLEQLVYPEL